MAYNVSFTSPNNKLNVKSFFLDCICHYYSDILLALSGMILIMVLVHVCVGRLTRRNEKTYDLKYILSLLSSQVCR